MSKEGGLKEDLAREEVLVEEAGLVEGEGPAAGKDPLLRAATGVSHNIPDNYPKESEHELCIDVTIARGFGDVSA